MLISAVCATIQSKSTTKAMEYARTAVQSAHHHYRQAMDLVDAVCGTKKNRWEAILGDEQSRQETYRGESRLSRSLTPPSPSLPSMPPSPLFRSRPIP